jgi:hypothetical protein
VIKKNTTVFFSSPHTEISHSYIIINKKPILCKT